MKAHSSIGYVAFCFDPSDSVIAHKIMDALKPLYQEGFLDCFVPESYDGVSSNNIVDARTAVILLSRALIANKQLCENAFSCYGCGQLQVPILLEECNFKSIPEMQPHEVWVEKDRAEIREMKYLPSNGTPLYQYPDQDEAVRKVANEFCKMMFD